MFDWLKKKHEACRAAEMPQVDTTTDLKAMLHSDLLVLFKHSTACPVSWAAHSQVSKFRANHPDVPVKMLKVIQERPVSQKVAELTGIRHESPQVLIIKGGTVVTAISHGAISEARLSQLITPSSSSDALPVPSGHPARS